MANLSSAIANWQKRQAELQAQQVDTEKVRQVAVHVTCLSSGTHAECSVLRLRVTLIRLLHLQKQPAKRKSSAAKAGGARSGKAAVATTLATSAGAGSSASAGPGRQDWRTAKTQKGERVVPIGKQLKVK